MYLASRSPQRKAILKALGLDFEVAAPSYAEAPRHGLTPSDLVESHSRGKAYSVISSLPPPGPGRPVLGVDTMVVIDGEAVGKAAGEDEALAFIRRLSGRTHEVYSGITLLRFGTGPWAGDEPVSGYAVRRVTDAGGATILEATGHAVTTVRFATILLEEMELYVSTGEWRQRAGAYAIQGKAAAFVEEIRGDYTNIVGLPVPLLVRMLRDGGLWPPGGWAPP